MFGNANVGLRDRCNLQVAGQLGYDSHFFVQRWYARLNRPLSSPQFTTLLESTIVEFMIGWRYVWQSPLSDLLRRRPGPDYDGEYNVVADPWPVFVANKQNINVTLSWSPQAYEDIHRALRGARLWIDLEGLHTPLLNDKDVERVLAHLTHLRTKTPDNVTFITNWLKKQIEDCAKPEEKHHIEVLRDAILEGRYR